VTAPADPTIEDLLGLAPVIPVVVVDDVAHAAPLAEALVEDGYPVIEVTLRTPAALEAIGAIASVPGAVVGAGTVCSPTQVQAALEAGARFLVSPGSTSRLLDALQDSGAPFLPGAVTPSEVLALLEREIDVAKFFPAEASGGVAAVKALAGPFPQMRMCPTGGIDQERAKRYLAEPNVICVGGSWMMRRVGGNENAGGHTAPPAFQS
jgi:2-dehydro-3-deoxyphosphogluconate aldolase/(4S)-4-hydroxy-2-oxoglutarate aldolase